MTALRYITFVARRLVSLREATLLGASVAVGVFAVITANSVLGNFSNAVLLQAKSRTPEIIIKRETGHDAAGTTKTPEEAIASAPGISGGQRVHVTKATFHSVAPQDCEKLPGEGPSAVSARLIAVPTLSLSGAVRTYREAKASDPKARRWAETQIARHVSAALVAIEDNAVASIVEEINGLYLAKQLERDYPLRKRLHAIQARPQLNRSDLKLLETISPFTKKRLSVDRARNLKRVKQSGDLAQIRRADPVPLIASASLATALESRMQYNDGKEFFASVQPSAPNANEGGLSERVDTFRIRNIATIAAPLFGAQERSATVPLWFAHHTDAIGSGASAEIEWWLSTTESADARAVAQKAQTILGPGWRVESWHARAEKAVAYVEILRIVVNAVVFLIVLLAIAAVAVSIWMEVVNRRATIGMLKTLGSTPRAIGTLFALKGLAVVALGCLIGVAVAYLVDYTILLERQNAFVSALLGKGVDAVESISVGLPLMVSGLTLLLSLGAIAVPSVYAARLNAIRNLQ